MRGLLKAMPAGVPLDTLLARIKGRRSGMIASWDRLLLTPEPLLGLAPAPWRPLRVGSDGERQALQREYVWLFGGLTEPLRERLAPVFWLWELRTLACCLRLLAGNRTVALVLLQESLLHKQVQELVSAASDREAAVRQLARFLIPHDPAFAELPERFRQGGDGALEASLHDLSLVHLATAATDPVIRRYLALQVDCRNLLALSLSLRGRLTDMPRQLPGGTISIHLLAAIFDRQDLAALAGLAARLGGGGQEAASDDIPRVLLLAQSRWLRNLRREPTGIGCLLDYLWRGGVEARNIGLLARQATAGSDLVVEELVA